MELPAPETEPADPLRDRPAKSDISIGNGHPLMVALTISMTVVVAVVVVTVAIEGQARLAAVGADLELAAVIGGTGPARGNVDRAMPVILRLLREFAEWHGAARRRCGDDAVRPLPMLDPVLERGQRVEIVGAGAAAAMLHPRHHEEPDLVLQLAERLLQRRGELLVIAD